MSRLVKQIRLLAHDTLPERLQQLEQACEMADCQVSVVAHDDGFVLAQCLHYEFGFTRLDDGVALERVIGTLGKLTTRNNLVS